MLSREDNDLMCRTGPDAPMGRAMRAQWMPAMHEADLPAPGGDPVRIELLGEHFIAWRDEEGRVGLFDEACLHRNASMALARAEGDGLRCIYHGWKFAVDGRVLETPNVADAQFKQRIKGRTHPVRVAGGLVWTYLGAAAQEPEFPDWPYMALPARHRINARAVVNCNYVQVIEGLVDSSHLTVLHASGLAQTNGSELDFAKKTSHMQFDASPRIEADETDFGFHYVAMRPTPAGRMARVASFIAPCFVANPNGDLWFAVVPMNDERCSFFHVWWSADKPIGEEPARSQQLKFVGLDDETLAAYGLTAASCEGDAAPTWSNGYRQDKARQRAGHFTGLASFTQEDAVCSISSGGIRDRSAELLCSADLALVRLYRVLLAVAHAARDGRPIPGVAVDASRRVIGIFGEIKPDQDWRSLVPQHRITAFAPPAAPTGAAMASAHA
jgi:phenylpropionate dioxygenase-like ring-hydroxylating dioxygenase large terminal subunit